MKDFLFVKSADSTNLLARNYAENGAEHGFMVVAEQQTAGKGRLGKYWYSQSGAGLYCTIVVRPQISIDKYSRITFAAGLAVCQVLEELLPVRLSLKWPNDLFLSHRKCGGILVEGASQPSEDANQFALVGIGLNLTHSRESFSRELRDTATSLYIETGKILIPLDLSQRIRTNLLCEIERLEGGEFSDILAEWRKRDMLVGKWMNWVTVAGGLVNGRSLGVTDEGALLVEDQLGRITEVISGDVSLARS